MLIDEKESKRKLQIKVDLIHPGLYTDEQMAVYQAKKNKFKKCSRKLPPAVNHEYDRKIFNFEHKLSKQEQERQNLIRQQSKTPNKKEILSKIINQIQSHLETKEKELFDKYHCDTPVALLNKKKSQFFQEKQHLELLEKMGQKIEQQKSQFQRSRQQSQFHQSTYTPRGQPRSHSLGQPEQSETKLFQSDRIHRIQENVNKEMGKLGLKSINISPDSLFDFKEKKLQFQEKSKSQTHLLKDLKRKSQLASQGSSFQNMVNLHSTQASLFKRFHLQIEDQEIKPQDINSVIKYCNTERKEIKSLTKDIAKNRRIQFRKFRIIQKELSTVGQLGFEGIKSKYLIQ